MNQDKLVGTIVGIYEIQYLHDHRAPDGHKLYHAKCTVCGFETDTKLSNIKAPKTCAHKCLGGHYRPANVGYTRKRLQRILRNMRRRCYSPRDKNYEWYGAKGVTICDEWLQNPKSFEDWALSNGYQDNLTIDRIDANLDYSPDNCRWVPNTENARRKSTTSYLDVDGEVHTGREWAHEMGMGVNTINQYIRKYGVDKVVEFIRRFKQNPPAVMDGSNYYKKYMTTLSPC